MLPREYFARMDESDDALFYAEPRLVVHIDEAAIARVVQLYREILPAGGAILDLMSSWRSHLPDDARYSAVIGLGMNEVEMRENPQLTGHVVQNLNANPRLPFEDEAFDGCVLTVSVQYLTRPVEVFAEVGRVLRPGAPFVTVFSNRMFPTKAVAVWQALGDEGHAQLVVTYYEMAGRFTRAEVIDSPQGRGDPVFAVVGYRAG